MVHGQFSYVTIEPYELPVTGFYLNNIADTNSYNVNLVNPAVYILKNHKAVNRLWSTTPLTKHKQCL